MYREIKDHQAHSTRIWLIKIWNLAISTVTLTFTASSLHAFLLFHFLNVAHLKSPKMESPIPRVHVSNVMRYITVMRYPMIHQQLFIKIKI